jgi:hypothetical protein
VDLTRLEGIFAVVGSLTTIIPFLLRLFVKPMITSELEKQTTQVRRLINDHLRLDHGYGGITRKGYRDRPNFKPEDNPNDQS